MCRQSMQMKWIEPSTLWRGEVPADLVQEGDELRRRHLARGHREFGMPDLPKTADVTVDRHVVGRVGEDHLRLLAGH